MYGLFALLALEPAYFIVTTFPNTMSYFNSMVGGTKGAYGNYEVDFYYNIFIKKYVFSLCKKNIK